MSQVLSKHSSSPINSGHPPSRSISRGIRFDFPSWSPVRSLNTAAHKSTWRGSWTSLCHQLPFLVNNQCCAARRPWRQFGCISNVPDVQLSLLGTRVLAYDGNIVELSIWVFTISQKYRPNETQIFIYDPHSLSSSFLRNSALMTVDMSP